MPTTRQGHLLKRHRFDTGAAGRKRRAEARGTGGAFNLSPSRDRSNRSVVSRSSSSLPPFLQISTDLSKTSRLCIYIREIGNRGSDVIESEGRRNCRESKRTTGWRLAFAESCYSAARQEAFAHRIVFVEIKQRFLDGLFRPGGRISFHSASFTSRCSLVGVNGNGRIIPFLLSKRLDYLLTSIQDEGGGKKKKKGKGGTN